jgi:hypothetical protein
MLLTIEKELAGKNNTQPLPLTRKFSLGKLILAALPILVLAGLLILYAINVTNLSWVRADIIVSQSITHSPNAPVTPEGWHRRAATFIGFAFLFAIANGVLLSHALYILGNRRQLRSLKKDFLTGAENDRTNELIGKYEQLEEAIAKRFVNSYNEGYNAAISERAKKTPLLMKILQPYKKS